MGYIDRASKNDIYEGGVLIRCSNSQSFHLWMGCEAHTNIKVINDIIDITIFLYFQEQSKVNWYL